MPIHTHNSSYRVIYIVGPDPTARVKRYVYDLAVHLPKDSFSVLVYSDDLQLNEHLYHAGVRAHPYGVWPSSWLAQLRTVAAIVQHERPDILHSNDALVALLCALVGRWYRIRPLIYTIHHHPTKNVSTFYRHLKQTWLCYLAILVSHRTIVPSPTILQTLQWRFIRRKLKLIAPGRTIGVMYSKEEARRELVSLGGKSTLPTQKNMHWIGTVSTLQPEKNITDLITAAQKLLSVHTRTMVVVIGDGTERTRLQQYIDSLHLSNRIFLLGEIPEAARFLHAFDIFVLPNATDDHSYTLHEAGLARLPVVAVAEKNTSSLLIHKKTGLIVPPEDPTALADSLHTLLTDHRLAEQLRHHLKEKIQTRSVEKMVAATTALYTTAS